MKRGIILTAILFIALLLPFASAGWLGDLFKKDVQESPQDFNVTVGNAAPTVGVTSITNPIVPAGLTGPVTIVFIATDNNGVGTLNNDAVSLTLDSVEIGEQTRTGTFADCDVPTDVNSTTRQYSCEVVMYYYDHEGDWTINVSIQDSSGTEGYDDDNVTVVPPLQEIRFTTDLIAFGTVAPGQTNLASSAPTTITNEGNYELDGIINYLYVNSTPLIGQTDNSENISADSFKAASSSVGDVCTSGTDLTGTPTADPIPSVILPKGSPGTPFPIEDINYCLISVPLISDQVYTTTVGTPWEVTI